MRFGIAVFPGSNCDRDCFHVATSVCGAEAIYIWHKDDKLDGVDCVILPGGFSYGDYLRPGALASRSRIMEAVLEFAKRGGLVVGICNGFQLLTESGLLPGALMRNKGLTFICKDAYLRVENVDTPFTSRYRRGGVIRMPIAHMDGCYFADSDTLRRLEDTGSIVFRYCDEDGNISSEANPNGSIGNIAGICNEKRNVIGLMPHPERCAEKILGGEDGLLFFRSIMDFIEGDTRR